MPSLSLFIASPAAAPSRFLGDPHRIQVHCVRRTVSAVILSDVVFPRIALCRPITTLTRSKLSYQGRESDIPPEANNNWHGGGCDRGGAGGSGGRGENGNSPEWGDNEVGLCALVAGSFANEVVGAMRREYYLNDGGDYKVEESRIDETRRRLFEEIRLFFLPDGFPESVGEFYLVYSFWRGLQNVISAMTSVLSTQALLTAVGVNAGNAAGWAAATNWILKDGFGTFGKLVTARMGGKYDADPKTWRLLSDVVFDIGISLELLTPLTPRYFLLLAAVGNFLKSVSITIGMACRNSILTTFVKRENLGEISAKNDAQNVVSNLVGMVLGIATARALPTVPAVRLNAFLFLTAVYSVFNYYSMRVVELTTLNRQRASLAIDYFIRGLPIPSPKFVNEHEKIIPFRRQRYADPKLRLGVPLNVLEGSIPEMVKYHRNDRYILDMGPRSINVVLRKDATNADLLEAMVVFCHLRRSLQHQLNSGSCRKACTFSEHRMKCIPTIRRVYDEIDPPTRHALIKKSRRYAKRNICRIIRGLSEAGYNMQTLLFAPERVRAEW